MKLSKYFTLAEMVKSDMAIRWGIDNIPTEEQIENLKALCINCLDKIRDYFGPVRINSGFRCLKLNTKIKGDKKSQHMKAEAGDFEVDNYTNDHVWNWIVTESDIDFDQCIAEFIGSHGTDGWIHVSYSRKRKNRNLITIASKVDGKTVYKNYTKEQIINGEYSF